MFIIFIKDKIVYILYQRVTKLPGKVFWDKLAKNKEFLLLPILFEKVQKDKRWTQKVVKKSLEIQEGVKLK